VIVRLWNRVREPRTVRVALGSTALGDRKIASIALCDLDEREQRSLPHSNGSAKVELAPHGLATLSFTLDA
jgi:hypothetical protein